MDNHQLVQFNQQQALITSRLEAVGTNTTQLQTQLDESTRDIHQLMNRLDERQEAQSETNRAFESQFTHLGQVLQDQQNSFGEQLNQQSAALRLLISQLGNRTESAVRSDTTSDIPVPTPVHSNGTSTELPVSTEEAIPLVDAAIVKTQLPLIPPRMYKGERKDNACELWCMDMHSFMRRFETLTNKTLSNEQAVEYISQYFADAALT